MPVISSGAGRPSPAPVRVVWPGVLSALVVVVVLGILGMHAFGDIHPMATDVDHASMAAQPSDPGTDAGDLSTGLAPSSGHADLLGNLAPDMSMMMLCGAMLLSASALLLLPRWRRAPRLLARRRAAVGVRAALAATGIVRTRPPPAWEFSVVRC